MTSMGCTLEPAIWSRDTGQQIPCFDRCQLIITWMSNIKEVNGKPRLHVSVIEVTSWLVSADDFSSRVASGANERVSAANE